MENPNQESVPSSDEDGPGKLYEIYSQNELVVERLKLLNYESEFESLGDSLKAVPRHYFVKSTNAGEQFHLFTSLSVWLIRKAGIAEMEMPHEYDDPNEILARIVDALKEKEVDVNFPLNKLKSGSGPQCIFVLLHLTGMALAHKGHTYGVMQVVEDDGSTEAADEDLNALDQAELTAEQFEDEVELAEDVDEPLAEIIERIPGNGAELGLSGIRDVEIGDSMMKGIMHSNFNDVDLMEEELKRVTPQLKVTIRANLKDWRMHAEQLQKYESLLDEQYGEVKPFLMRTSDEIGKAMERIQIREQDLNDQFSGLLQLYRNKQNELAAVTEQYKESSGTVNSRNEILNSLNEEIDHIKQQIEEQGAQNTSGAPILKIKQALTKMEKDSFVMRVQIATLEQALLQTQLADHLNENALDYLNY